MQLSSSLYTLTSFPLQSKHIGTHLDGSACLTSSLTLASDNLRGKVFRGRPVQSQDSEDLGARPTLQGRMFYGKMNGIPFSRLKSPPTATNFTSIITASHRSYPVSVTTQPSLFNKLACQAWSCHFSHTTDRALHYNHRAQSMVHCSFAPFNFNPQVPSLLI
eukprot:768465-Hanusia_phi.AAC.5